MSHAAALGQLLEDPRLWRAARPPAVAAQCLDTGWASLNELLGGGWPPGQLTELQVSAPGAGELGLLLPALARLTRASAVAAALRWVALIAPPYLPYAPALAQAGVDLARLLLVRVRRDRTGAARERDTLWAFEQALHSASCAAVIGWADSVTPTALRRLQLAAEGSGAWVVLVRSDGCCGLPSPAPLRLRLTRGSTASRLRLEVLKRRGGLPAAAELPA
jgi:hypothetical protein